MSLEGAIGWIYFGAGGVSSNGPGLAGMVLLVPMSWPISMTNVGIQFRTPIHSKTPIQAKFLSSQLVRRFMKEDQEVAIAELEALAALWQCNFGWMISRAGMLFSVLTMKSPRSGFIKGYSQADMVSRICNVGNELCEGCVAMPWFMRVPFAANLADFPSRFVEHPFLDADRLVLHEVAENALHAATATLLASVPSNGVGAGAWMRSWAECCSNPNYTKGVLRKKVR